MITFNGRNYRKFLVLVEDNYKGEYFTIPCDSFKEVKKTIRKLGEAFCDELEKAGKYRPSFLDCFSDWDFYYCDDELKISRSISLADPDYCDDYKEFEIK